MTFTLTDFHSLAVEHWFKSLHIQRANFPLAWFDDDSMKYKYQTKMYNYHNTQMNDAQTWEIALKKKTKTHTYTTSRFIVWTFHWPRSANKINKPTKQIHYLTLIPKWAVCLVLLLFLMKLILYALNAQCSYIKCEIQPNDNVTETKNELYVNASIDSDVD